MSAISQSDVSNQPSSAPQRLRAARVKNGPLVEVIHLSENGVLIESPLRIRPGSDTMLQLMTARKELTVLCRVLWCEVAAVGRAGVLYRSECAFTQPFDMSSL